MRVVIPIWRGQVCTVFDFACRLLVVDTDHAGQMCSSEIPFEEESMTARVRTLSRLRTEVLICGAISSDLAKMVASYGIEIVPFVKGPVKEVLAAFLTGEIFSNGWHATSPRSRRLPSRASKKSKSLW